MKLVEPTIEILDPIDQDYILKKLERIGRICYKSEDKIKEDSAEKFITGIIKSGHESVIEHVSISIRIICDRGVSHEIVRHRIASYSQESTRYCCYDNELQVIQPPLSDKQEKYDWFCAMKIAEECYTDLIRGGVKPEIARSVLPNSLKTELVMTANLREWRHFIKLRASKYAHPQMRQIAQMILVELSDKLPVIFGDLEV